MLVLSRREGEAIELPEVDVLVRVIGLKKSKVQLGIEAPKQITVRRSEQSRCERNNSTVGKTRLNDEVVQLEKEIEAIAKMVAGSESEEAKQMAGNAIERLRGIKVSVGLSSRVQSALVSECVTIRSDVFDRLRIGQPKKVQPTEQVRQPATGYAIISSRRAAC